MIPENGGLPQRRALANLLATQPISSPPHRQMAPKSAKSMAAQPEVIFTRQSPPLGEISAAPLAQRDVAKAKTVNREI